MPNVRALEGVLKVESQASWNVTRFPWHFFQRSPNLPPSHRYTSHLCANQHIKSRLQQASTQTHLLIHRIQAKFPLRSLLPASPFSIVFCTINLHLKTTTLYHHSSHSHHTLSHNLSKGNNAFGCTCSRVPCHWHSRSSQTCSELCGSQRGWWFRTHEHCGSTNDSGLYCR